MKQGICHLCGQDKELAESHLIPKFVFRWMKNSGGNYFRTPLNPNVRMQDGLKEHLLCLDCEQKFSKYEKWFADNIFFPYLNGKHEFLEYNENLGNFIVSVLWRRLLWKKIVNEPYFEEVFNDWKAYLNGDSIIKYDNIHLLFLGEIWHNEVQPHEFVHRYFNRATDANIAQIGDETIVFAKFSRFIVLAELDGIGENFRGTKVLFRKSRFPFAQFIDNGKISLFFVERAKDAFQLALQNISEKEKGKIVEEIDRNSSTFWKSDAGKTVSKDLDSKIAPFEIDDRMRYVCDCCLTSLQEPNGYLLRTYEILKSASYWKFLFNTNEYGVDQTGLDKRVESFKVVASFTSPWVICDECIDKFDVDRTENKEYMNNWISKKGKYTPPQCDDFRNYLSEESIGRVLKMIVTIS
jgi:hypothetical protein